MGCPALSFESLLTRGRARGPRKAAFKEDWLALGKRGRQREPRRSQGRCEGWFGRDRRC